MCKMHILREVMMAARHFVDLPTVLVAMSTCLLSYLYLQRHRNLPPGPRPWPIVGNIPYLMWLKPQFGPTFLTDLSKTYGDVLCFWIALKLHVVISGHDTIRRALVTRADHFSSRRIPPTQAYIRGDGTTTKAAKGVLFAEYGPDWKQQRRFSLKTLRDFGVGKRSLEGKICDEAAALSRELLTKDGQPFDIKHLLQNSVSNIICSIVFGKRFEYGDPEFLLIITLLNNVVDTKPGKDILVNIHPVFRHIPYASPEDKKLTKNLLGMQAFCKEQIQQHRKTFDPNDIRDFIDAFLLEQQHACAGGDQSQTGFTDKQLQEVLLDLFLAGTETTSTTMCWALYYMVLYPHIQEKVHQEIESVLGQAVPSYALREKMPYTTATLAEVQRINTILPYSVPHAVSRDTTLNGYNIPDDAVILVNLWSVHMDPQLFPEPDKFNPDRFLDRHGNFVKHEALIPFSVGPRVCLGEQLARMELFLLFVSLMQRFTFQLPEGAPTPSTPGKMTALINMPQPYELCAVPRG
ncbi:PREDICTED: cytochrome P450 2U1-like [Branchiostoma belcheri]|uniref:Cytochrome P450 2U1 n=1 Tax=Branchiostoma belcheri TaxID=7741 RepID=A0A6P5AE03_BRABE|nr:PREDICTED: cytochrome P450 2U1-like [Branchiostoma belcheri]